MVVVARREPIGRSLRKEGSTHDEGRVRLIYLQTVEGEHADERAVQVLLEVEASAKLLNGLWVEDGSMEIKSASFGQRKEPLDIVVSGFQ